MNCSNKQKQQYLYRYIDVGKRIEQLHAEIRGLEDELHSLEEHQQSPSFMLDVLPKSKKTADLSAYMVKREKLIEQIRTSIIREDEILQELYDARDAVAEAIESLDAGDKYTDEYKTILRYRYMEPVNGNPMKWDDIADKMHLGFDTVKHKHKDAIDHLKIGTIKHDDL